MEHIELKESGTYVKIGEDIYPLYVDVTYEDSRKIDAVLDVVDNLPISEFLLQKKISMHFKKSSLFV